MKTYVWVSFAFMGWAYYEMSGGSDFVPEQRPVEAVAVAEAPAAPQPAPEPQVTRADTASLLSVGTASAEAEVVQASLEITEDPADPLEEAIAQAIELQTFESLAEGAEPSVTPSPAPVESLDLRAVAGVRVNMRQGPGTDYGVIVTLPQGTEVEVLEVDSAGWARLLVTESGQEGWMAERLLTDPA